jgi:hypothetical protein
MSRVALPVVVLLLAVVVVNGCAPKPTAPAAAPGVPGETPAVAGPTAATSGGGTLGAPSIEGVAFPSQYAPNGQVVLTQGRAEVPLAAGSASTLLVQLGQQVAIDDFNGDGQTDIAIVLISSPGGSGTFYDLYVVLGDNGQARPLPPVNLGDRIKVESVVSQDGQVVVNYLTHAPDQPMAAEPTQAVTRAFKVEGDKVVEVTQPGSAPVTPGAAGTPGVTGVAPAAATATP